MFVETNPLRTHGFAVTTPQGFGALYDLALPQVFRSMMRLTGGNRAQSEDLTQDAFGELVRSITAALLAVAAASGVAYVAVNKPTESQAPVATQPAPPPQVSPDPTAADPTAVDPSASNPATEVSTPDITAPEPAAAASFNVPVVDIDPNLPTTASTQLAIVGTRSASSVSTPTASADGRLAMIVEAGEVAIVDGAGSVSSVSYPVDAGWAPQSVRIGPTDVAYLLEYDESTVEVAATSGFRSPATRYRLAAIALSGERVGERVFDYGVVLEHSCGEGVCQVNADRQNGLLYPWENDPAANLLPVDRTGAGLPRDALPPIVNASATEVVEFASPEVDTSACAPGCDTVAIHVTQAVTVVDGGSARTWNFRYDEETELDEAAPTFRLAPDGSLLGIADGLGSRKYLIRLGVNGAVGARQIGTGTVTGEVIASADGRGALAMVIDPNRTVRLVRFEF
jgi:hypothetical protein